MALFPVSYHAKSRAWNTAFQTEKRSKSMVDRFFSTVLPLILLQLLDHVYCSPNWAVRDGTPYSIARIMEFLTAEGTTRGTRAKGRDACTRVRLAWYYRPSDVSDRQVTDSRLLLCAIYSEIIPVTQLRAKCYVKHKDRIYDLIAWKKRPDRFYYNRLFDPFIKREFEVILTSEIRNRRFCY